MIGYLTMFFSWFLATLAWSPIGLYLLKKLDAELLDRPVHNFIIATVVGAALNSAFIAILSFWIPITITVSVAFALLNVILFNRTYRKAILQSASTIKDWSIFYSVGFSIFIAIAVLCSMHTSLNNDSGLYYIQFVKWISNYPVVPGLANLHDRLGFNSHWHLLSAAFNVNKFGGFTNDLNGFLFILVGLGSFDSAARLKKKPNLYDAIWVLFPLPFFLLLRFLTSSAPDLPSTLIPLLYFSLLLDKKHKASLPIIATLIVFVSTIKVISIFHALATIPLLFGVIKKGKWKDVFISIGLVVLICIPWLSRNVIQTGYLIFPMESIDFFGFDWKVPNELAANTRKMVDIHARFGSYDMSNYGKPMNIWIPTWLNVQSKSILVILISTVFSSLYLLTTGMLHWFQKKTNEAAILNVFVALSVVISLLFWWESGPNPRFIYGALFFLFAYAGSIIIFSFNLNGWVRFGPLLALIPMLVISKTVINEAGPKRPHEFLTIKNTNGTIYYPVKTDKCWENDIPCANMNRDDLKFRGSRLQDGFSNTSN
jgi:hypothetical protein